jgi:hypothetical protein
MSYKVITTVAAAFAAMGLAPNFTPDVSMWPERFRAHKEVEFKLQMVVTAINGEWVEDWNDTTQWKWFNWFDIIKKETRVSGVGLSFFAADCAYAYARAAPRLVFENSEKAEHAAEHFLELYEAYYLDK